MRIGPAATFNMLARIERASALAGLGRVGTIDGGMSFRGWCEELARNGLKVDRKPFRLDDRPALVPIYDAIPTTAAEAHDRVLVVQKATQLGLTVWEVLADVYMAKRWGPINIGLFLPDQATAGFKSEHRFMPILRSAPMLHRELTHRMEDDGRETRIGEGNVLTRAFANSLLMFLWTSGKVSTESRPMDVVSLDEVQEMTLAQIDKVMARVGDSEIAFKLLLSTANMPDADIHHWYLRGTQEVWHTECQTCGEASDLSDPAGIFPARSIALNSTGKVPRATGGPDVPLDDYVWTCPACRHHIPDPQVGRYIAANPNPGNTVRSFLLPRTISPRETPRKMMESWQHARTGDQKKSFYNRTLARPYIDADQLPVTMAHCLAAVAEGKRAGVAWRDSGRGTFMGVDQMGGWNAVLIKERRPDGRQALIHAAAIFDEDPFAECSRLMDQYGVAVCVVEQLPNVNDARRFANRHRGRVFLAGYADLRDDMMVWGDDLSRSDRRTIEDERSRYTVSLNQYKAMQASLYRVRDLHCLFPDPAALECDVLDDGKPRRIALLSEWVFLHFTKTALVLEHKEDERKPRPKVLKVGIDPHYSFANMLCDVAWARSHGASTIFIPGMTSEVAMNEMSKPTPQQVADKQVEAVERSMPGLPQAILSMMADVPEGTCGRCTGYDNGMCTVRSLIVQPRDPSCVLYIKAKR